MTFLIAGALLSLISFFGDKSDIPPTFRLPIQFIAALTVLLPLEVSNTFSAYYSLPPPICILFFAVFIVGTANFYNFMDGINGIAGVTGVIGFGLLGFHTFFTGTDDSFLGTLAICISFACLGFLPFNMPQAKVFMGDVGSILLGFVFASMVVLLSENFLDFICQSAFLFPFYADELTTMVVRLNNGDNLTEPHRKHFYQLLANEMGIPHWKISIGYGISQFLIGMSVLFLKPVGLIAVLFLLIFYFTAFTIVSYKIRHTIYQASVSS